MLRFFLISMLVGCSSSAPGMQLNTYLTQDSQANMSVLPSVQVIPITPIVIDYNNKMIEVNDRSIAPITHDKLQENYEYRVGPQDVLSVIVWDHPELNNPTQSTATYEQLGFLVNHSGDIYYPYIGKVHVAGMTVAQIRAILVRKLATYVINPSINVRIITYNSKFVNVIGEVSKPSKLTITNTPLTILQAINQAGGATSYGDLKHVILRRGQNIYELNLTATKADSSITNLLVEDGDIINVPNYDNYKIFVLGEVVRPGSIIINQSNMSLNDAINEAGSINLTTSNPEWIFVFRREKAKVVAYRLNARSPDMLILANEFLMQPKDIVYVSTYKLTNWNRIISQLLPTTQVGSNVQTTGASIRKYRGI